MSEIIVDAIADKSVPEMLMDTFTPLVDEAKIHFNDDGVHMRAVEMANVAMAYVDLSASAFESYDSPGAVTQGANLNTIAERLDVGDDGDLAHLYLDMETRKLNVDVENINQSVGLIDPDSIRQEPDLPGLELPNNVVLTGKQIQDAIDAIDMVSTHVKILGDVDGRTVTFRGEGDVDATDVDFDRERVQEGTEVNEEASSLYSLDYMKSLTKPIPKDAEVTIEFGQEKPLILDWTALDGQLEVKQMVAPRIQVK